MVREAEHQHVSLPRALFLSVVLLALPARALTPDAGVAERPPPATVTFDGEPVLVLTERVFGYAPEQRAADISRRLPRIVHSPTFLIADVRSEDHGDLTMVYWKDELLFTVAAADAAAVHLTRQQLAARAIAALGEAIQHASSARGAKALLLDFGYALAATLALVLAILALNWGTRAARARLERWFRLAGRKLHSYSTTEKLAALAVALIRALRWVLILAFLYAYVPAVFSFFPWTRDWGATLLKWTLDPVRGLAQGLVNYLPNVFIIVIAVLLVNWLIRLLRAVFDELGAGRIKLSGFYPEWAQPTFQLIRALVVVGTGVALFPYLPGAKSPAFQGVSIFLGALLTFGSSSAISNLIAGVILTYTRAFEVGDRIRAGETYGDVIEKTLLVTRVRTIKNEEVAIPNALVMGMHIVNYTAAMRNKGLVLHTQVTIGYDAPWRKVHALLLTAAHATPRILADPEPFVWQKSLDDFFVTYELNASTDHPEVLDDTYAELHKAIRDAFDAAGVEILSPHYAALRDGGRSTVVPPEKVGPREKKDPRG